MRAVELLLPLLELAVGFRLQMTARSSPSSFVLLSNLQSGSNIGSICRNCLAFNVTEVVVVGKPDFRGKMRQADRGAKARLAFINFPSTSAAVDYLKNDKGCLMIGLEIMPTAKSLVDYHFPADRNVAFLLGNEGGGLNEAQRRACDDFVYIPQYSEGLASINVACCSAIVLQRYAEQAGYQESTRVGEKFS